MDGNQRKKPGNPILHGISIIRHEGIVTFIVLFFKKLFVQYKILSRHLRFWLTIPRGAKVIIIQDIHVNPLPSPHQASVDIIIYIHNAFEDFQSCLESVLKQTAHPFKIILVDDGSDEASQRYLVNLAETHHFSLFRNDSALGYTQAMNSVMRQSSAEYVILLNGRIIVTSDWVDSMLACIQNDLRCGLVGVLSNRNSFQSNPEIFPIGVIGDIPLPANASPTEMGKLVTKYSGRLYPKMKSLDDFCLLISHRVIDQLSDFRDDYCLRAREAGWQLMLADNTYVFQAQQDQDIQANQQKLVKVTDTVQAREGGEAIASGEAKHNRKDRVLDGIYWHNRFITERENLIQQGLEHFSNHKVLFVLPVKSAGGGSNSVFLAVQAMRKMGVDAQIMNLDINRPSFIKAYPNIGVPFFFGDIKDIPNVATQFDAVVATSNITVAWIAPVIQKRSDMLIGYYIQDYEPYFYPPDSEDYRAAAASYTLIPNQTLCVTTQWIYDQIQQHHGLPCHLVGGHIDTDLFRPRPLPDIPSSNKPIRIAAMIRPVSERRSPRMTMDILQQAFNIYGSKLEFLLFGCEPIDPGFASLPKKFPWRLAGELRPAQIANLLNQSDIFIDYSVFQALGLTALESMCCGLATIVPSHGGTSTFAKHENNCLVVDTSNQKACFNALQRLIEDDTLRQKLQKNAISTGVQFYPELPAYNILKALFPNRE